MSGYKKMWHIVGWPKTSSGFPMLQKSQINFLAKPIHRKKYYPALEKKKILPYSTTWMNLEDVTLKSKKPAMEKVYDSTFMKYLNQI